MNTRRYVLFGIAILFIAAFFRYPALNQRTMHTDEAVHAFKLAELLENGNYHYDPNEYHGPALYYLSLPLVKAFGQHDLSAMNETALRMVVAIFGTGIILLVLLMAGLTGSKTALLSALLMALSPPLVFYARYYIHETLLVFFNLGWIISLLKFNQSNHKIWLVIAGVFAGLMVATKETWVILVASQLLAFMGMKYETLLSKAGLRTLVRQCRIRHLVLFLLPAIAIASVLFSSFFENPAGIADALLAYKNYVVRAGQHNDHIQPWYYYGAMAFTKNCDGLPFRAEIWLLMAGAAGIIMGFIPGHKNDLKHHVPEKQTEFFPLRLPDHQLVKRYLGLSFIFGAFFFSVIPYKTPWNGLFIYTFLAFPAGYFVHRIYAMTKKKICRVIIHVIAGLMILHLGWQSYADNFINSEDPCNPYVYAHPDKDLQRLTKEINSIAVAAPEGNDLFVEVIVPDHGYWPLPWYLRQYTNTGWYAEVQTSTTAAPLIVCAPEYTGALSHKLYEMPEPGKRYLYIPVFEDAVNLRPGTSVQVYLRMDYLERYLSGRHVLLP